ncbi:MAG: 2'-5' RNA ligase family protein [Actinomycetota bacterium]|jgi:2'-5' RNA ligase|nr:2'-5' RNA ligase family protein [Rubrobacter sp.]MDQ3508059.1 2'-5' RNA ligase family protein [Actinomycetota bacterium]
MEEFHKSWERFSSERTLEFGGHTDASWKGSHSVSACLVIPIDDEKFRDRLEPLRDALRPFPFVSLHPDHFMHITLAPIGFPVDEPSEEDEISWSELDEVEENARDALSGMSPFPLTLANLNAFPAAAFVEVHSEDGSLGELCDKLRRIPGLGKTSSLPHLTLAYFHALEGSEAPDALVSAIEKHRDWPVAEIEAKEVKVSLLELDSEYPRPEARARIKLGR